MARRKSVKADTMLAVLEAVEGPEDHVVIDLPGNLFGLPEQEEQDIINGNGIYADAEFENFGPLTEEEKEALHERLGPDDVNMPLPNHDAMVEERELGADDAYDDDNPAVQEIMEIIEQGQELERMIADRPIYVLTVQDMIAAGASKRLTARWMIQHGWDVKSATRDLNELGMKIRYQQVYQATEDLRSASQETKRLGTCSVCGRPLSDPDHAKAGIGPVCAGKKSVAGKNLPGKGK